MAKKIKAVVLGTAHPHVFAVAQSAAALADVELAGVYDADAQRRQASAEKLGVPALASLDEAVGGAALALIGAVPSDRAGLAEKAISAGAAVLTDKPLAVTHEALDQLIATQRKVRRPVIVYYPYRGDRLVRAARTLVEAGEIGQVVRVFAAGPHKLNPAGRPDWHWTRQHNGGIFIDIGSHHADFCCWIAGEAPNWISATHHNFTQPDHAEFQDFAQAQLRFPSGAFGHLEVDWLNPASTKTFGDTRFWIQGTKGKIEMRLGDEKSGYLWTDTVAAKPFDAAGGVDMATWTAALIDDLAHGRACDVPQEDVWQSSRVTLHLFDSAQRGGEPIRDPKF